MRRLAHRLMHLENLQLDLLHFLQQLHASAIDEMLQQFRGARNQEEAGERI